MKSTDFVDNTQLRTDIPDFAAGDEVKVHVKVVEGNKERVQIFQGNVIGIQGSGVAETYTVRKLSYGVGVERIFPVHSPRIEKIEIGFRGRVRRARLFYMRELEGKKARLRESTRERIQEGGKLTKKAAAAAAAAAAATAKDAG